MKMNKLKRSHDRKVTNLVNNAGNGSVFTGTAISLMINIPGHGNM